jgi:hypothetical protein
LRPTEARTRGLGGLAYAGCSRPIGSRKGYPVLRTLLTWRMIHSPRILHWGMRALDAFHWLASVHAHVESTGRHAPDHWSAAGRKPPWPSVPYLFGGRPWFYQFTTWPADLGAKPWVPNPPQAGSCTVAFYGPLKRRAVSRTSKTPCAQQPPGYASLRLLGEAVGWAPPGSGNAPGHMSKRVFEHLGF